SLNNPANNSRWVTQQVSEQVLVMPFPVVTRTTVPSTFPPTLETSSEIFRLLEWSSGHKI
ncbi:hypothetical protein NSQ27_25310, partial [Salmonella enterica]|nr:hypothetical protein [Salmonella enterica]